MVTFPGWLTLGCLRLVEVKPRSEPKINKTLQSPLEATANTRPNRSLWLGETFWSIIKPRALLKKKNEQPKRITLGFQATYTRSPASASSPNHIAELELLPINVGTRRTARMKTHQNYDNKNPQFFLHDKAFDFWLQQFEYFSKLDF